jgi:hypothetical protein
LLKPISEPDADTLTQGSNRSFYFFLMVVLDEVRGLDEVRVLIEDVLEDGATERDLMLVFFFPETLLVRTLGTL